MEVSSRASRPGRFILVKNLGTNEYRGWPQQRRYERFREEKSILPAGIRTPVYPLFSVVTVYIYIYIYIYIYMCVCVCVYVCIYTREQTCTT